MSEGSAIIEQRERWQMPFYKLQREYTNWEEVTVEADSEDNALELADEEETWNHAYDVNSYNYTGEVWVEETNE
jgi:hypothetical protein